MSGIRNLPGRRSSAAGVSNGGYVPIPPREHATTSHQTVYYAAAGAACVAACLLTSCIHH
jgi:hypothetical protein